MYYYNNLNDSDFMHERGKYETIDIVFHPGVHSDILQ